MHSLCEVHVPQSVLIDKSSQKTHSSFKHEVTWKSQTTHCSRIWSMYETTLQFQTYVQVGGGEGAKRK